ncbi:MAG: DNA polymerase III subunit delta' [Xanthomonadales bacterium]|nr:DNA polymerase III subunit delta' [Xanthomonadales bacterium]
MPLSALPPWLAPLASRLAARIADPGLPHAILIAGPAGIGKRMLAEWLVAALLCRQPEADGSGCGRCRDCIMREAGSHPDLIRVGLGERTDGRARQEILIDQIRSLSARLATPAQRGGRRLALIDPADRMNAAAANAFLKTLEEPGPERHLLLVADEPERLLATVRSRCLRLEPGLPERQRSLDWLVASGLPPALAAEALDLAEGAPLRALALAREEAAAGLLGAVRSELQALEAGERSAAELARRWLADRPQLRLALAERLARRRLAARALTDPALFSKLDRWLGQAARLRQELGGPLRPDVLLAGLLASWPAERDRK